MIFSRLSHGIGDVSRLVVNAKRQRRLSPEAQKGTIETAGALPGLLGPLTLLVARFPPQSHLMVALLF